MSKFRLEINRLLNKIKKGDKLKQQILFDTTYNHLKIIALMYAKDKNDYEDILLESYLRAFKYINNFDSKKDGYNWLCKIVENVSYDYNNKVEITEPLVGKLEKNLFNERYFEERDVLISEIIKLPIYEQKLLYMKFWENYSYSEIAEILKSKKSTIHRQTTSIIKKLMEMLSE